MSTTIDERVVEMRFDNRDFEKNVATSMSTLEKLKQKLHLTGASKGIEDINNAAKRVNFSPISNSFDQMAVKFSHTQATLQHQLDRWMDRIVGGAERMVKALTIDPVKTGFQEYETQMNAVQTILANTQSKGSTLTDVNKALDELNAYADKTIYNFTEMTRNIGTFTAAGVDLDTSVNAIQGIANLAAISGSTSQQASTAMYQLSQALASGTVKLMDWNSVVNAGMGGQVFQDALKETARVHGVAIDSMIEEQGSFRETLSKGWLTSEILTETLQKFTLTTEGLTEEQIKANREMLKAKGYTDAQIDEIFKLGDTATQAATKVKTFTQLWDVLKESAQSGWSQTWKLIIGDFEEAKALLSPLADFLTGAIGKMSEFRNKILEKALDNPFTDLLDKINDVTEATEAVTNVTKNYADIVKKVIGGDYGNGQARWDKLTEEGYDWAKVQNMVNEELGCSVRHTEKLADAQGKQTEAQKNASRAQSYSIGTLVKFSDQQLRAMGYTTENINALRTLEKQSERTGIPIEELAEDISLLSGRSLLINSFKNAGQGLVKVFQAMKGAWKDVFPDTMNIDKMASALYDFLAAMHKFSTNLIMTDETADKLRRTFAGLFAIIDIVTTILGGGFKIAFKVIRSILGYFDVDLLGLTANIGDAIVKFNNWFNSLFDISGLLDFIIPLLKTGAKTVAGWIESFKDLPIVQKFVSKIKMAFDSLKDIDFKEIGRNIIDGFKNGFSEGVGNIVDKMFELGTKILTTIKDVLGIHSPSTEFFDIAIWCVKGFVQGLVQGLKFVGSGIANFGKAIVDAFQESGIVDGIKEIYNKAKDVLSKFDFKKLLALIPITVALLVVKKIYDFATSFSSVMDSIQGVIDEAAGVLKSFSKLLKGLSFKMYAEGIKELAISLAIMVGSIAVLTYLDTDKMYDAVAVIFLLAVILGILAVAMNYISKASVSFKKGEGLNVDGLTSSLASIGLALLMVAGSVKLIGSLNPEEFKRGMIGLAAVIGGLVVVMGVFAILGKTGSSGDIDKLGKMIFKLSLSMILLVGFCKLASKLDADSLKYGAGFAVAFLAFVGLLAEIADNRTGDMDKLGKMVFKLSLSMILLVGFCKLAGKLTPREMKRAGAFAAAFVIFVAALTAITAIAGEKKLAKLSGLLVSITFSMLLMIGVAKLVSKLKPKDIIAGTIFMAAFLGFAWALTKVTTISNTQKSAKIAGTILAMSVAIAALAVVSILMSMLSVEGIAKGVGAVVFLCAGMAMMVKSAKSVSKNAKSTIVSLIVAVAAMGILVALLGNMDPKKLGVGLAAVSILMLVFKSLITSLKSIKGAKGLVKNILAMTALVVVLGSLLAGLSFVAKLTGGKAMLSAAGALSAILLAFSAAFVILGKAGKISSTVTKYLLPMTLVAAGLGAVLAGLAAVAHFTKDGSMLEASVALSILLNAFASAMVILGHTGRLSTTVKPMLGPMVLVTLGLAAILGALSVVASLTSNGTLLASAISLSILLNALATSMVILGYVGLTAKTAVASLGLMTLIVGGLAIILGILAYFDIAPSMETALALSTLLLAMSGALVILGVVGLLGPAAYVGIGALATLIIGLGTIITGIGALMEKFPQLEEFLNKGIPILGQIGTAIGEFIGNIAGGIIEGIGASLPTFGQNLSDFMTNAQVFIDGIKNVDETALAGAGYLAGAIIALTAADLISSVTDFITIGSGFADLGTKLSDFMTNAGIFFEGLQGIDPAVIESIGTLATAILKLTAADLISGIISLIGGEVDFSTFGTQLVAFGEAIAGFSAKVAGKIDQGAVEAAAAAGAVMAEFQRTLYGTGGVIQWFCGEKDMSLFASQLTAFADAIVSFSSKVAGNIDQGAVEAAAAAGAVMAEFQKSLVPTGGVVQWFTGEKDMALFGLQLVAFGGALVEFSKIVSAEEAVNEKAIEAAARVGELMTTLQSHITPIGGVVGFFCGDQSFETFGTQLVLFGEALVDFSDTVAGNLDMDAISAAESAGTMMATLQSSIPEDKWLDGKVSLDDFGKQIKKFGEKIVDYSDTVTEIDNVAVGNSTSAAGKILGLAQNLVGLDTSGMDNFDPEPLGDALKAYADAVAEIDTIVIGNSTRAAGQIITLINNMAGLDTSGVGSFTSAITDLGNVSIDGFVEAFSGHASELFNIGSNLIDSVIRGAQSKQHALVTAIGTVTNGMSKAVSDKMSTFQNHAKNLMATFASGISSNKAKVSTALTGALTTASMVARGQYTNFYSAGSYLVDGFTSGISANMYKAAAKAAAMAEAARQAAEEALGIASPSKVFYGIGDYSGQGFVNALADYSRKSYLAGSDMADSARKGLTNAIANITDSLNGKVDMQPTIRPVIDLSGVEYGTSAINSMLAMGSSIGVSANVSTVSSMMSRRVQNGGNSDIVAAIDKLDKHLDNVGNTSYNVNGITYDDGSNVQAAIETLVRAARIERRT